MWLYILHIITFRSGSYNETLMFYKKKIDINLYVAQMSLPPRYRRCTIAPLLSAIRVTDILAPRNPMLWCGVAQTYRQNISARGPKLQINDNLAI